MRVGPELLVFGVLAAEVRIDLGFGFRLDLALLLGSRR